MGDLGGIGYRGTERVQEMEQYVLRGLDGHRMLRDSRLAYLSTWRRSLHSCELVIHNGRLHSSRLTDRSEWIGGLFFLTHA